MESVKARNSVDWQGDAWYRVMSGAGTRIPEDPFMSVQTSDGSYPSNWAHCYTFCPGYLPSGSHPKTPGELVENVKVCRNCNGKMCNSKVGNNVKIRHCGDYFVYHLRSLTLTTINNPVSRFCTE